MKGEAVFGAVHDRSMASLIANANQRVILAAPGIRNETARALVAAFDRLGPGRVEAIVDADPSVFRLGYGDIEALKLIQSSALRVREAPGIRIGILITDEEAWAFAPTALYVQREVHSDETPNAVRLSQREARRIFEAISAGPSDPRPDEEIEGASAESQTPEIGIETLKDERVEEVRADLAVAPPRPFDVARQARVFEPYIQFVEISFVGGGIRRKQFRLPRELAGVLVGSESEEMRERLTLTYKLAAEDSGAILKKVHVELDRIRRTYTRSAGADRGMVMLIHQQKQFEREVKQLQDRLADSGDAISAAIDESMEELITSVTNTLVKNTDLEVPRRFASENDGRTDAQLKRDWVRATIVRSLPDPDDLVAKMVIKVNYKGVTYETLSDPDFQVDLKQAFPDVPWDRPLNEFHAAREREQGEAP